MAISVNTLMDEAKCYLCLGISEFQAMQLALLNRIASGGGGVLEYEANLTQSGTAAPVATVLKNTLGGTPVWTRNAPGIYTLTLSGAFPVARTVCYINQISQPDPPNSFAQGMCSIGDGVNTMVLTTTFADISAGWGVGAYDFSDDVIGGAPLSLLIRVYP